MLTAEANRRTAFASARWLTAQHVATIASTALVGILMANHLGVQDFGRYTLALSVTTLATTLVTGGLSGIVVKELVERPDAGPSILGATVALRAAGGVACVLLIGLVIQFGGYGRETNVLLLVMGLATLTKTFDGTEFYFHAGSQARFAALAGIASVAAGTVLRVAMVLAGASLVTFAWAFVAETVTRTAVLLWFYARTAGSPFAWRTDWARVRDLGGKSGWLLLSTIALVFNTRIDQVMLGSMSGPEQVGLYGVAARFSEVWHVLPTIAMTALFPNILRMRSDPGRYRRRLQQALDCFFWMGVVVGFVTLLAAQPLVDLAFGPEYAGAAPILVVHVWAGVFVAMGAVLAKWLVAEGLLKSVMLRHGLGAPINVVLNLWLIPRYGGIGAAYATLVSYGSAHYLSTYLSARSRPLGAMMTRTPLAPFRWAPVLLERVRAR